MKNKYKIIFIFLLMYTNLVYSHGGIYSFGDNRNENLVCGKFSEELQNSSIPLKVIDGLFFLLIKVYVNG
jgi:hypothetical protein